MKCYGLERLNIKHATPPFVCKGTGNELRAQPIPIKMSGL